MKAIKDKRRDHNRPYEGEWCYRGDKDERKERRKMFKSVRHKLLMRIPLTDEENDFKLQNHIYEDSKMTFDGYNVSCKP